MQHRYLDTSNLNAPYGQSAVSGGGSLGTGSLGSLGASSDDFPWKEYSSQTKELQAVANKILAKDGFCQISTDGKLGPATCGAVRYADIGMMPENCQGETAPRRPPCGGGVAPAPPGPPGLPPEPEGYKAPGGGFAMGDALWVVGGLAVAGGALWWAKSRK